MTMPLGEKIRQLRGERGWSQGELAARLGGDPGQISRYETGKISPSIDVVVKLAETFDVSADYLLIAGAARRPLRAPTDLLGERLAQLDQLTPDDRAALIHILDHMLANNRARPHSHTPADRTQRQSAQRPREHLLDEARAHQPVLGALLSRARPNLLLPKKLRRIIVVVEDVERPTGQLLIANEYRHRPIGPIPGVEAAEDRPLALRQTQVTEPPNEDRVVRPQVTDIVERRKLIASRPEEVAEQRSLRVRASDNANRKAARTKRDRKPVALCVVDARHQPPPSRSRYWNAASI